MAKSRPQVSVIIPCYNLGMYLKDAIASVKAQTFQDFEIIVVDDGSTDEPTIEVLDSINEDNVQVFRIKNKKLPGARNYGISKARGEYITCLDADDMLAQEYLEKTVPELENNKSKNIAFVTTWLKEFGERNNIWQTSSFDVTKLLVTNIVHAGSLFRKEVWEKIGGYQESMTMGYEDWEFWLNIVEKGYKWEVIPEPLFLYRIRKNSMLSSSKFVHMDIYQKLYELHSQLFLKYSKDLVLESAKELKELHEIIHQKDETLKEYQVYKDEVISLREQIHKIRNELYALKNSRVIGRIIRYRKTYGEIATKLKQLPRRTLSKLRRLIAPLLPSVIKRKGKTAWRLLTNKPINYVLVKNSFWGEQLPLVSVVIPYYNREDTIDETLNSLVTQTFNNFETILVNDGSTDLISIKKLESLSRPSIKLEIIHQKNQGVAAARNTGIKNSKGKYIICLDSDDMLEPTFIEKASVFLETHPGISLATSHIHMFGDNEGVIKAREYSAEELIRNNMVITAAMFTRQAWEKVGGYKSVIGYEDWEFWINLAEKGFFGKRINEILFNYRTALQSRYIEDTQRHHENMISIKTLHPNYRQTIKKFIKERKTQMPVIEPSSAFINLDDQNYYNFEEGKNVLIAIPWMTFGGAETLIVNFCNEVKDKYNLSFITGLESEHEWEYKFKEITPHIYHLTNLFDDPSLYLEFISNYVKTRNIDILHIIHTSFMFDMLPELKNRHPELKIIVTIFNDRAEHFQRSVEKQKFIDAFTSDNLSVVNHYMKEGINEDKLTIIPNGIDSFEVFNPGLYDRLKERQELGLEQEDIAVFFIGRLSEEKNPDVFLNVAKSVVKEKNHVKFFVVGDGALRHQVEKMTSSIHSDRVNYLGYKPAVAKYLSAADIFVLPSSIEGFPLSILEAMAMRVAVVASNVGAVSEVIESGKEGYVVTPGSAKEIAESIIHFVDDRKILENMKTQARQKIQKKYSNKLLGDNYKNLYEGLLK